MFGQPFVVPLRNIVKMLGAPLEALGPLIPNDVVVIAKYLMAVAVEAFDDRQKKMSTRMKAEIGREQPYPQAPVRVGRIAVAKIFAPERFGV